MNSAMSCSLLVHLCYDHQALVLDAGERTWPIIGSLALSKDGLGDCLRQAELVEHPLTTPLLFDEDEVRVYHSLVNILDSPFRWFLPITMIR